MKFLMITALFLWLGLFCPGLRTFAQTPEKINWLTFSQLDDSLKVKPKKVFVDFYADWCTYCKEMEGSTFTDKKVIEMLNHDYYAVKMNVESRDTIVFGQQRFINKRSRKVNPVHEIALLMASRKDKPFSLPAFVVLDEKFSAKARYFQFLDAKSMIDILAKKIVDH
ncbi:MAG: thioredoxin family protein [Chitinophagaceae bacterium]